MLARSNVFICVGKNTFDQWQELHVTSSMLEASDKFSFQTPVALKVNGQRELESKGLVEGAECTIWARDASGKSVQQHTGRIDDMIFDTSASAGSILFVSGRDHMGPIVDSDAMPSIALAGCTFRDVITKALEPFGFSWRQITISNDANRNLLTGAPVANSGVSPDAPKDLATLKIAQARPHAGETVQAYLMRHAKRFGLLIWGTADGGIVVGRPNYNQKPLYSLQCNEAREPEKNNVQTIRRHRDVKQIPSEIHCFGKSHGHDWFRTGVHAILEDEYTKRSGFYRVLTMSDTNCRTNAEALTRAKYEMSLKRQSMDTISVGTHDISQNGVFFAVDTVANVSYDVGGIQGEPWYVVGRDFSKSFGKGTTSQLTLLPKGAIALGQAPFSDREGSEGSEGSSSGQTDKVDKSPKNDSRDYLSELVHGDE